MAKVWMAVIEGKQHGPLSNSELKSLADGRRLKPTDHVWKEGMAEWIPASKIKGLFPPEPPPMPPAPEPPVTASPPEVASAAKNLFGVIAGAAKRAGSRVREAAENAAEPPVTNPVGATPEVSDSSPKLPRRTWVLAAIGGGGLLLSCVVCGAIGSLIGGGSSSDVIKPDGKAPTRDEERKHVEQFGPKPQYSSYDGSFEEVKKYLADSLNDPRSVEYVEWSKVVMGDDGWNIRAKYRAKNGFGAIITKDQVFTVRNGKVAWARDR